MNARLFKLFALAFDGVASVGPYSSTDGTIVMYVHPSPGESLPSSEKMERALTIGERLEGKLGIVVIVKPFVREQLAITG